MAKNEASAKNQLVSRSGGKPAEKKTSLGENTMKQQKGSFTKPIAKKGQQLSGRRSGNR